MSIYHRDSSTLEVPEMRGESEALDVVVGEKKNVSVNRNRGQVYLSYIIVKVHG